MIASPSVGREETETGRKGKEESRGRCCREGTEGHGIGGTVMEGADKKGRHAGSLIWDAGF